jgi:starch-binding outer membrane protein, SusD/RagB family
MTLFKHKLLGLPLMASLLLACNKNLDYLPKDQLTVETTFKDYNGFKTYAWQFYNFFPGYVEGVPNSDFNGDLFLNANANGQSSWAFQLIVIPSSSADYNTPYARIRTVNVMLDQIDGSPLNEKDKNHWRSVGYFFRAYNYMDLLNKYGAVPLILHAIGEADPALQMPRTSRDSVAAQILADLSYAEENIKPAGDGANTINTNVVRALISRFGLREGTWRKYHNLAGAETYLRASTAASEKLMTAFPSLAASYDLDFNSNSLAGVAGIILYKQYETAQLIHVLSSRARQSVGRWDLTKKAVDMYLMTDGQTRFTSPLFQGDKSPYTEFRSRDKRLYYTVPPPFKIKVSGQTWSHTGNAADAEYFTLMASISDDQHKTLPTMNWGGIPVVSEPHFADDAKGQAFCVTYTGYRCYKFANKIINGVQNQDINDAPVFRIAEVLLNYAEAKYELGELSQEVIDKTVNKLRGRGGVAALSLSAIPDDPARDPAVAPELWEIRRERAIELMGEGFRFDDLRRWKKLDYISERKIGRWIKKGVDVASNAPVPILGGGTEGYIAYEPVPPGSIPDYYYLYPIPSDQIVLTNNAIVQNPGWK